MANLIEITDVADPRLVEYVRLRDASLRRLLESEHGVFIAEGAKVIRRAAQAGFQARSFLLAERWLDGLSDVLAQTQAPVYVLSSEAIEHLTGFHVHRGALASFARRPELPFETVLSMRRVVVCEVVGDHTNLGAIIRSAAGLGWDGVVVDTYAADPLYRRAIKTSMGTVFDIPWVHMSDWAHDLDRLKGSGFRVVAMALRSDAVDLARFAADPARADERIALLLGNEGDGLSERWIAQADTVVTIPMARGIDSLNVGAAAAIACYELRAPQAS